MSKIPFLFVLITLILINSVEGVQECHEIEKANSQQVWQIMKLSNFDRYFLLIAGSISILLLIGTALTWLPYRSFSTPADIMFAIVISQIIQNSALVVQASYFSYSDNQLTKPPNFDQACYAFGIWNVIGSVSSIYYNLIFCVILAYSIQKTLKGFLFNRLKYHLLSLFIAASIILILIFTQGLGRGLNGVCGFRVASQESTARFIIQLLISIICIYSMITFRLKLPKNQFFQKQSAFGLYNLYMGMFAITQIISSASYLASDIMCKTQTPNITQKLHIFYSISICSSILLSYFLIFMRFKHPQLRRKISQFFKTTKKQVQASQTDRKITAALQDQDLDDEKGSSWFGCLLQSLKGSQILSFLEGITVAFIEKQRKFTNRQLQMLSFQKHYSFNVNERIVQNYIQKRISSRQSFIVQQKLGGLIGLDYSVTSYCPEVFSSLCTRQQLRSIIRSLDIKKNIKVVKKQSYMNGGKSGELFFTTFDNRIIFKTIQQDEVLSYMEKIKDFAEYFSKQKQTLIVKILGMFKFLRKDINEEPIFLMMMYNITMLPRQLNLRVYDIKGSEFNRSSIKENRIKNKEEKLRRFTLKDKDFKVLQTKIRIDPNQAMDLKRIAKNDVLFLGSLGFMDYSLIIIKRQGDLSYGFNKTSQAKSSEQEGIIYNFGIIDYLESWTLKRKAERAIKTLITSEKVTADSPLNYSHRLSEFIDSIL